MSLLENQVANDRRLMGIPIKGNPSDGLQLQYSFSEKAFVWVTPSSGSGSNMITLTRRSFQKQATSQGEISIQGDKDSIELGMRGQTGIINRAESMHRNDSNAPYQAGSFGANAIICIQSVNTLINPLEVWISNTVDTADGTKIIDNTLQLNIGAFVSYAVHIPSGKFLTINITGEASIIQEDSTILELGA